MNKYEYKFTFDADGKYFVMSFDGDLIVLKAIVAALFIILVLLFTLLHVIIGLL